MDTNNIRYATETSDLRFTIRAVELDSAPNPLGSTYATVNGVRTLLMSKESAWQAARQQTLPVFFVGIDGNAKALGTVFHPAVFERRVYSGYVGYGLSMTDGYYAPIKFDAWVKSFRANPDSWSVGGNDSRHTTADLDAYKAALATL